ALSSRRGTASSASGARSTSWRASSFRWWQMRATSIVFRRELAAYLRSPVGYIVAALVLLIDGILFQAMALGGGRRLSAEVLRQFFYFGSGTTMIAAVALSVRLIAEERQLGTMVLLHTSPIRDVEIVAGKFLAAWTFLAAITLATLYMPLLILVHGKITFAHAAVGYPGRPLPPSPPLPAAAPARPVRPAGGGGCARGRVLPLFPPPRGPPPAAQAGGRRPRPLRAALHPVHERRPPPAGRRLLSGDDLLL